MKFWNKLPKDVKLSGSVDTFKINLQGYKTNNENNTMNGNFWDVSHEVLTRIEGEGYLENKASHNEYLKLNLFAARKKFINIHSSGEHL